MKFNDGKLIENYGRPYIIAEVNTSHFGDIEKAKEMIQEIKKAGCDCVKFQSWKSHTLYAESYFKENPISKRFFEKFSMDESQLEEISIYCNSIGISFASTPYSNDEVDLLVKCKVPFIKIASMDINNLQFLEYIASKKLPIILSTGMSTFEEIDQAVKVIKSTGHDKLAILHCVSIYPTKDENININNISGLMSRFPDIPIGFSDHTTSTHIPAASVALGACIIEKHFTLDNSKIGMDNQMALEKDEMAILVKSCHSVYKSLGIKNRVVSEEEEIQKKEMRRSIISSKELSSGKILELEDVLLKRPGNGIPADKLDTVLGKKINKDIGKEHVFNEKDFFD